MKTNFSAVLLAFAIFGLPASCLGQRIVRIEEDWEMQVVQPDEQLDAPQVTTCMLPFGSSSNLLFQLDINHGSTPSFSAGGLQLRICDDDRCYSSVRILAGVKLRQQSEQLSWTQVVQKSPEGYLFGIINGSSSSLGTMADAQDVAYISDSEVGPGSLETYDLRNSLENSEVSYAGNRIGWLRLRNIRVYYSNGQLVQLPLNSDIHL